MPIFPAGETRFFSEVAYRLNPQKSGEKDGFAKDYCQYGLWLTASGARRLQG